MTIEIDFSYVIDGFYHSVNYYRSETPMNPESMPAATATGITELTYTDTTATKGINYYVRFGSVRSGIEKISEEIRVLAGTAWTPDNLSAQIYLDADDLSGTSVSSWTDRKGGAFEQTNSSLRPNLITNELNGKKIVRFDGVDDSLYCTAKNNLFASVGAGYCFTVYKKRSATVGAGGAPIFYVAASTTETNRFNVLSIRESTNLPAFAARTLNTDSFGIVGKATSDVGNYVISGAIASWSSGSISLYSNGSLVGSASVTASTTSSTTPYALRLGSGELNSSASAFTDCDIACVVVGNTSLSTTDRQKLEGWAAHKYGLTANLPSGHPYKTNPPVV